MRHLSLLVLAAITLAGCVSVTGNPPPPKNETVVVPPGSTATVTH